MGKQGLGDGFELLKVLSRPDTGIQKVIGRFGQRSRLSCALT